MSLTGCGELLEKPDSTEKPKPYDATSLKITELKKLKELFPRDWNAPERGQHPASTEMRLLKRITGKKRKIEHIAYFSVPPVVFKDIVRNLGETRRSKKDDIRLIIEKPFGEDKKSAEELYHFVSQYFTEKQVYLLDHYLGKTSVQSILHLRRSNRILSHMLHGSEI
ncbi:MAG: hypothetical protein HN996_03250, partial [Opitutae bacterium]|nr:hypothetical protein [Opitutae bacterium]